MGAQTGTRNRLQGGLAGQYLPYGSLGHYLFSVRFVLVATQAADSRLFELRNGGSNSVILTHLKITWLQTAAHTAAIEDSLDVYKVTGFSGLDSVNTVTPVPSVKRTTGMTAGGGNVQLRHVTVAGAAAGMTGGTMTKDARPFASLPQWLLLAQPTGGTVIPLEKDALADMNSSRGSHPFLLAASEGIVIENRVLLGAAAGSTVNVECGFTEAPNFE